MNAILSTIIDKILLSCEAKTCVVGINGAQGSGKSTIANNLSNILREKHQRNVALLSLDDLYKTKAERMQMARKIHPLFITRGVPGTHDVALGVELLTALKNSHNNSSIALPRFDKALDDRLQKNEWSIIKGKVDIVIFEGWCVGATPQNAQELIAPVNELEKNEDVGGMWRNYVNSELAGEYQKLFSFLDLLVMLKIPTFDLVYKHRLQQEHQLRQQAMSDSQVKRFVMHYQRLTEHMLKTMPAYADILLSVDEQHRYQLIPRK